MLTWILSGNERRRNILPEPRDKKTKSSIFPRFPLRKIFRRIGSFLPLKTRDVILRFWIQTRLLFSKTILLITLALFGFFVVLTIDGEIHSEHDVYEALFIQSIGLAVILHMSLWDVEREGRTFELLFMCIPNVHRMIWYKIRVSLLWTFLLSLPFFAGYGWFVTIPVFRMLVYLVFCMTTVLFVALFTCVVSSYVHRGLATGIIVMIVIMIFFHMMDRMSRVAYLRMTHSPWIESLGRYRKFGTLLGNRIILVGLCLCLYSWLASRLKKTEKWILS